MNHMVRTAIAALAIGVAATAANAQMKEAKDVKIAVVVHGSASDPYWSVVKRGVDDAAALTGAQVQYVSPQVFDEVEHARLIDAAVATKPDGLIVSIADPDALRDSVTAAIAASIPTMNIDLTRSPARRWGHLLSARCGIRLRQEAGDRLGKAGVLKVVCINHEVGNASSTIAAAA
jgi:simple sugar transport system substrate-binding protein